MSNLDVTTLRSSVMTRLRRAMARLRRVQKHTFCTPDLYQELLSQSITALIN